MACSLALLPSFLSEQSVVTLAKGKRRSFLKPSTAESMQFFVDIQKVSACITCLYFSKMMLINGDTLLISWREVVY